MQQCPIFNAIGHLTKTDFEKALQNIRTNLKDGGVYVFDIFNLQAITDNVIADFAMDTENVVSGVKIRNKQHSEIDKEKGLLTSHDHYTILKNAGEQEIHTNTFLYKFIQLINYGPYLNEMILKLFITMILMEMIL